MNLLRTGLDIGEVVRDHIRKEVSRVIHYDYEFHRQRQRERMAEIAAEYQRAQATDSSRVAAAISRSVRWAWSRRRWAFQRRAPVFRA
jgi:hypothetical protein